MPTPQMLEGMRQPQSVRLEDMRKNAEATVGLPLPSADGVNVYVSGSRGYLCEVENVPSYVDQGRRYPAKRVAAQFVEGVYRNNERDLKKRAAIDESLQSNKYFGKFGDSSAHFWLLSDMLNVTAEARAKNAFAVLKSLPRDQVEQFVADLKQGDADDHEFAPTAAEVKTAQRIRPIAAQ